MDDLNKLRDLLDDDGENRAVRTFLMSYGGGSHKVGSIRYSLTMSGFDGCWPEWVGQEPEGAHLTKAGAQLWLRHLFDLEAARRQPDAGVVDTAEEDAYVIERMGKLLAEVAIAVKGPEAALHRHSYHDLPELVQKAMLELELFRGQEATPPASPVPQGFVLVPDAANVDEIVSRLYRRFKDWSARGFGPDDVTWCEVKADIQAMIAKASPVPADRAAILEEAVALFQPQGRDYFGHEIRTAIRALASQPVEVVPEQRSDSTDVKGGADAVDGARYRWLRDSRKSGACIRALYEDGTVVPDAVDEMIDRAIAAESAAQGGKG